MMIKDVPTLKSEIVSSLDTLSLENLQLLHGFATLLSRRSQQPAASSDNSSSLPESTPIAEEEIPAANRTGWKEWDQRFDQ
jgi:hypothetical protein